MTGSDIKLNVADIEQGWISVGLSLRLLSQVAEEEKLDVQEFWNHALVVADVVQATPEFVQKLDWDWLHVVGEWVGAFVRAELLYETKGGESQMVYELVIYFHGG